MQVQVLQTEDGEHLDDDLIHHRFQILHNIILHEKQIDLNKIDYEHLKHLEEILMLVVHEHLDDFDEVDDEHVIDEVEVADILEVEVEVEVVDLITHELVKLIDELIIPIDMLK